MTIGKACNACLACMENTPLIYKLVAPITSPYPSDIFNLSYEQGTFPLLLKKAKIISIHKAGSKDRVSNYRPISILSAVSKVFEKLLYIRLEKFFSSYNIITKQQCGFRQVYSTEMAITDVCNILRNNSNDRYISCIFLDVSKAFDTVNHKILQEKVDKYGIRGNMQKLQQIYLSDCVQYTECNHTKSARSKIVCGVQQGSTLGPLLFSL